MMDEHKLCMSGNSVSAGLLLCTLTVFGFLAGACGSDDTSTDLDDSGQVTSADKDSDPDSASAGSTPDGAGNGEDNGDLDPGSASSGWIDGEPDWRFSYDGDETAESGSGRLKSHASKAADDTSYSRAAPGVAADDDDHRASTADHDSSEAATSLEAESSPDAAVSLEVESRPDTPEPHQSRRKLTGGSIDDNDRFEDYLSYRARIKGLGIPVRDLDPRGRIVVSVIGANGLPVAGTEVAFSGGGVDVFLRTTADGSVRFHPGAHGAVAELFTVTAGGVSVETSRGEEVAIDTTLPTADGDVIPLDILFLLDATGSMGDEIGQLKATITEVAQHVHRLSTEVDVHFAMTLYRDEGDAFVTATHDFTSDVGAFAEALADVVADGGGDYPEALDEALAEALAKPAWRPPEDVLQLVFLVADAPPQISRTVQTPYTASMLEAAGRGIKILPVSSSGTDDQAEYVFRQLAQFTGGRYVFLTYGAEGRGTATGSTTDITQLDYEDLSLDDLIVRLVAEEIAALTGSDDLVPVPEPTPAPVDGQ